jgi:hypothetical protein
VQSSQGRHIRPSNTWRPLPPAVQPGRYRRNGDSPGFRSLAVVSILATLTTSTAFGLGPETSFDPPVVQASVLGSEAPGALPPIQLLPGPSPSSTSAPQILLALAPPTTLTDPTPEEILVMRTAEPTEDWTDFVSSIAFVAAGPPLAVAAPVNREDCIRRAKASPVKVDGVFDRNLIAQMTYSVFECITGVAGLDSVAPTSQRSWKGAEIWGFESLAEQVAAEAIVVAYCESMGFSPRALTGSNGFGYAGLFQMGSREMARFGEPGSSRNDPVDNAIAAAKYFLFQYQNRNGWGGWSPWAVVNTNFEDEINSQVRVPVLPRFASTDSEFRGRRGPELPAWAVDPWRWEVPHWSRTGCSFTGRSWPAASPLGEDH